MPEGHVRWSLTTKVPLHDTEGHIIGLVGISHDITRRKVAEEGLQRRTDEMEVDVADGARQIQESFLPRTYPVFPRGVPAESSALRFAHRYIPATTLGGDFFDIVQLSDAKCGMLVCDASWAMSCALDSSRRSSAASPARIGERAEDPARVLAEINHGLTARSSSKPANRCLPPRSSA